MCTFGVIFTYDTDSMSILKVLGKVVLPRIVLTSTVFMNVIGKRKHVGVPKINAPNPYILINPQYLLKF